MKHRLPLAFVVLLLAACGELTATPVPSEAPDLTTIQIAVEEAVDTATAVEPAVATNTPAGTGSHAATTLPTDMPTNAPTPTSPSAMLLAANPGTTTQLPPPRLSGTVSLEEALAKRRSVREFDDRPLSLAELGQLLWAAQGITDQAGRRTAPSARALYPLELFVTTAAGVFHYDPGGHQLIVVSPEDARMMLYQASGSQESVRQAPAVFVVTAVYERTTKQYGKNRGSRYVHLEAGHATQNMLLEAVALGLGTVSVGAFDDRDVRKGLDLPADHQPLYLVPVGHARVGGQ